VLSSPVSDLVVGIQRVAEGRDLEVAAREVRLVDRGGDVVEDEVAETAVILDSLAEGLAAVRAAED